MPIVQLFLTTFLQHDCHDSNTLLQVCSMYAVAEKGFKVLTVKEKHYKRVRDYYRSVLGDEIDVEEFISEAKALQEEMRKNKATKLDPLKVKHIWDASA